MSNSLVTFRALNGGAAPLVLNQAEVSASARADPPAPQLGLGQLDRASSSAFSKGDIAVVIEEATALARALAGPDGAGARLRMLCRAAGVERTRAATLELLLGEALGRRDFEAVEQVDKLMSSAARRLAILVAELRIEQGLASRSTLIVARPGR